MFNPHCATRLKNVVEGEQGGISQDVDWQGGGGFHFYKLGETFFNEEGKIHPAVRFRSLAAHVWLTETHTPQLRNFAAYLSHRKKKLAQLAAFSPNLAL